MDDAQTRRHWVTRVLLVPPRAATATGAASALSIWQAAKDAADTQLNTLYRTMRSSRLPMLGEIAGEIEHTLDGFRVRLVATLMSYDQASGEARAKARVVAAKAVADARARLATDSRVIAADTNPFGVPVSVGTTLGAALAKLERQLGAG
jgi:hypothetical protein